MADLLRFPATGGAGRQRCPRSLPANVTSLTARRLKREWAKRAEAEDVKDQLQTALRRYLMLSAEAELA